MERLNESRIGAVLTEAFAVRASTATASTPHAQHGVGLLVGLDGDVTVKEPGRASVRGRVVVVPPHLRHAVDSPGPTLGFLHDPQLAPHVAGLPIRTFLLWRRLLVAVGATARLDVTSAAHFAGFADLAHFSRTCRRMLGYSPTALRSRLLP